VVNAAALEQLADEDALVDECDVIPVGREFAVVILTLTRVDDPALQPVGAE